MSISSGNKSQMRTMTIDITMTDQGINWKFDQRDEEWLNARGWSLVLVEVPACKPDYRSYIDSDAWKQRSREAKIAANFRCQVCNSQGVLDTHHRTYERLGRETTSDLIVLCRACHDIFHESGKLARSPR
jgi:hypothetical protein